MKTMHEIMCETNEKKIKMNKHELEEDEDDDYYTPEWKKQDEYGCPCCSMETNSYDGMSSDSE